MSNKIKELEEKLKTAEGEEKAKILHTLAVAFYTSDLEKALMYGENMLELAKKLGLNNDIARSYTVIGTSYGIKGNFDKALEYFFIALNVQNETENNIEIARTYVYIGNVYNKRSEYDEALEFYLKASKIKERADHQDIVLASCYNNVGTIYKYQGDIDRALKYYLKAMELYKKCGNEGFVAASYHNIGIIYRGQGRTDEALEFNLKSLELRKRINDRNGTAESYISIGNIWADQNDDDQALEYYFEALKIFEEIGIRSSIAISCIEIGMIQVRLSQYDLAREYLEKGLQHAIETEAKKEEMLIYRELSNLYELQTDFEQALYYFKKQTELEKEIFNVEKSKKIAEMQTKYETEKKEKEVEIYRLKNVELVKEQEKSNSLLLNILPQKIVEDLKETGKAEPETFKNVSVFFSDFVNFTNMSSNISAKVVIDELSDLFTHFDDIMMKNQCERIKTIGDAYLAVCGMPQSNEDHARNILKSAIKIINYLKDRNQQNELKWSIRIGIHSGEVVGGIVGKKKYIYDVFGDAINTASRMESNSEAMKINVSEATYQLIKNEFDFVERKALSVKGKGKIKMYFLNVH